ncbi:helix-turn-helix transcriptional regulator [Mesorhizobium sp. RP14(2022)]|uniref:Helix-turn-helix transcriptional regulator n=1 Tax=Mesorhizobium liriopis TaxID=2953882 RepID=A0ABT1C303_9HYPH|nr:helix-turn-helix transcriptional regulator [Mesorhizobium liriopis]MCO6048381.1 helix-turn-helix transcriptional regulator [Mesorhizobium liriopis]
MNKTRKPFSDTELVHFLEKCILQCSAVKNQSEIAREAGFKRPNMLSMIKTGESKLPIDRVPALAKALDCDPVRLLKLAFAQSNDKTTMETIDVIFGTLATANERVWLDAIRDASGITDPALTIRAKRLIRALFGAS